jgi:hypothetical protein
MRASTAFEAIDDPLDPAWIGHADGSSHALHRRAFVAVAAVVLVVLVGVLATTAFAQRSGGERDAVKAPPVDASTAASDTIEAPPVLPTPTLPREPAPGSSPVDEPAPAATGGSGWAPAAATVKPQDAGSGLLVGDLAGVSPVLIMRLDALAVVLDRELEVVSGWRTRHEQTGLYQRYVAGQGNLAAIPGTSNHEFGRAADVYVDGVALADVPTVTAKALTVGLHFPVPGEAWHVELL